MRRVLPVFAVVVLCAVGAVELQSQQAATPQVNPDLFKEMRWRLIGPFRGGRAIGVAGIPGDANTFYFGAVAGGVWKTTDGGNTWNPIWDKQSVASIGDIAVAPSEPNTVYVGTGEACIRGNISHGDGVYKSTDAGKTWTHIGLRDTRTIGRVIVHPRDANTVFVAALGHVYGPNAERGLFRTRDGGKTWEKVLYRDEKTGAIDVAFAPGNPNILYAAMWEANRSPWGATSGGPGSGLFRSTDGGTTWTRLAPVGATLGSPAAGSPASDAGRGLPRGMLGRIGISVSGADPNRVWALIEADEQSGGLYRSDDGGDTWRRINDDRRFRQRAWYYTHVNADPKNIDTVYIMNTGFYKSTDGGRTFSTIPTPHGDNHGLWIDPTEPQRMINANDGGANVSVNGGRTWTRQDNQPTAQFYHVITDNQTPYHVYGAQQDNSTVAIASASDQGGIDAADWYTVGGCESGYIAPRHDDPNIVYAGCYGGHITRFDRRTGQAQEVMAWPENPMGHGAAELKHRWQWTAPIVVSIHDSNVLYHAAEVVFKSTNGGMSWTAISPDLTRNDKSKQGPSGGPITKDNTSVEYYDTIFTLAESRHDKALLWAGTDDGLIHISRDSGKTWSNVTPKDLPEWSLISLIEASPHAAGTAYAAVDRHELDDFRPYIYRTADFGKTWTRIDRGIAENTFVRAVREDPKRKGLLYAGTETGVWVSFDDGANWQPLQLNLPVAPIHDLVVKNDDLVVATHGRSFWILDDLAPLQQLAAGRAQIAAADAHLFTPSPAQRGRGTRGGGGGMSGANPPSGAVIYYTLKSAPRDAITLEILDAQGKRVRQFSSRREGAAGASDDEEGGGRRGPQGTPRLPANAGMNRFTWDLRYDPAANVPGAPIWSGSVAGPVAVPGTYQLKLTAGGKTLTAPLQVTLDSRVKTSQADLQKQFDLLMRIRESVTRAHDAVNGIRELRSQIAELKKHRDSSESAKKVAAAAEELEKKLLPIEEQIIQVKARSSQDLLNYPIQVNNKLMALAGIIESADAAPTEQSYAVFDALNARLAPALAQWNALVAKDVAALNELARRESVPLLKLK